MNPVAILSVALVLVASAQGGIRVVRQSGSGWGSSPSPGWSGPGPVNIEMQGASEAIGAGAAISEHDATVNVAGSPDVPALLSLSTGSGGGLYNSASNYQSSNINADGSSYAYQGNSAGNSGYSNDYLYGDAQGLNINSETAGWSAVQGEGAAGQADSLIHQGGVQSHM